MKNPRLVVCLSGSGTTLQNLMDRIVGGYLEASIVRVISNRAEVRGVERARAAGIDTVIVPNRPAEDFSERVFAEIREVKPDLVILAGWLKLLKVPADYHGKVLNIHPSLLPAFGGQGMYGNKVHEAVLASGVKVSGCTVHFVDDVYDHGPVVLQRSCPVLPDDTPETLAARVFAEECEAYPEAIRRVTTVTI